MQETGEEMLVMRGWGDYVATTRNEAEGEMSWRERTN